MSFAAKANVAMRTTTSVQSSRQLVVAAPVLGPGAPRLAAGRHQQLRPCSALTTAPGQTASEHMNKNFLDVAIGTVLAWFDEPQEQTSEELQQLSPELRAYLEELEAHGSGHGSWVHSHIAERLATTTSQDAGSE